MRDLHIIWQSIWCHGEEKTVFVRCVHSRAVLDCIVKGRILTWLSERVCVLSIIPLVADRAVELMTPLLFVVGGGEKNAAALSMSMSYRLCSHVTPLSINFVLVEQELEIYPTDPTRVQLFHWTAA